MADNTSDIKHMDIKEFQEGGYLHEVNRLLLHPLGLALEVTRVREPGVSVTFKADDFERVQRGLADAVGQLPSRATATREILTKLLGSFNQHAEHYEDGDVFLGGVWDCRNDAEGIAFGEDLLSVERATAVANEIEARGAARIAERGYVVQPVAPEAKQLSLTVKEHTEFRIGPNGEIDAGEERPGVVVDGEVLP